MADFFAKGNKPINGYGGVGEHIVELWTNENPSSNFNATTVSLDLTNYKGVIVTGSDYGKLMSAVGIKEAGGVLFNQYVYNERLLNSIRNFTVNNTGVTFMDCTLNQQTSTNSKFTSQTDNGGCKPLKIYGLL